MSGIYNVTTQTYLDCLFKNNDTLTSARETWFFITLSLTLLNFYRNLTFDSTKLMVTLF